MSVRVWTVRVSGSSFLLQDAAAVLSADELERAVSFQRAEDRARYIVSHVSLRQTLASLLAVRPREVNIEATPCVSCGYPHGKPALPAETGLQFSLTHSGDVVMYAIGPLPVGIDVERLPDNCQHQELHTALHGSELASVRRQPEALRELAFLQCWTRKEAYLKGIGEGLNREPSSLRVGLGPRFGEPDPDHLQDWRIMDLDPAPGYAGRWLSIHRPECQQFQLPVFEHAELPAGA